MSDIKYKLTKCSLLKWCNDMKRSYYTIVLRDLKYNTCNYYIKLCNADEVKNEQFKYTNIKDYYFVFPSNVQSIPRMFNKQYKDMVYYDEFFRIYIYTNNGITYSIEQKIYDSINNMINDGKLIEIDIPN